MSRLKCPEGYVSLTLKERLSVLCAALDAHDPPLLLPSAPGQPGVPDIDVISRLISEDGLRLFSKANGKYTPFGAELVRISQERGLMDLEEFMRKGGMDESLVVSKVAEDAVYTAVQAWLTNLRQTGQKIPRKTFGDDEVPNFSLIAWEVNIDRRVLVRNNSVGKVAILQAAIELGYVDTKRYLRETQSTWVRRATKHIKSGPCDVIALNFGTKIKFTDARNIRIDRLIRHLHTRHIEPNRPLPEGDGKGARPAYSKIFSDAGLKFEGYVPEAIAIDYIHITASLVGIGLHRHRPRLAPFASFAQLKHAGALYYRLTKGALDAQNEGRFLWVLNTLMKAVGLSEQSALSETFTVLLNDSMEKGLAATQSKNSGDHFLGGMKIWYKVHGLSVPFEEGELPANFAEALGRLRKESRFKSIRDMCRGGKVEQYAPLVKDWIYVGVKPTRSQEPIVKALENALNCRAGTLTSRMAATESNLFVDRLAPADRPGPFRHKQLWDLVRPLLPVNFASLDRCEQEDIAQSFHEEFMGTNDYRERLRAYHKDKYRMTNVPRRLAREWEEYTSAKTSLIPKVPGQKPWRASSVRVTWSFLNQYFSVIRLPKNKLGMEIEIDDLSLIHLAVPELQKQFLTWLLDRHPEGLSSVLSSLAGVISGFVSPAQVGSGHPFRRKGRLGYLHSIIPSLRSIAPIPGVLTQEEIDSWQDDASWVDFLTSGYDHIWALNATMKHDYTPNRDSFDPILPILKMDRPLDALIDMLERMYKALPPKAISSSFARAVALRRYVSILILVRSGLRRGNVANLTYNERGTGKFRRGADTWSIVIPASEFKNPHGPHFSEGRGRKVYFSFEMYEEDTDILDEYVFVSRNVLLEHDKPTDALLLNRVGGDINGSTLYEDMEASTFRYVVYHAYTGIGIRGVQTFGPHAIRHILATHVLKITGNPQKAAWAIHDSLEVVMKNYARFTAEDKTKIVRDEIMKDLRRIH